MWLNDLFWGIRAHFLGETVTFGDERSLWRALSTLWTNPPKKILARGRAPPPPFLAMPGFWVHMVPKPTPKLEMA